MEELPLFPLRTVLFPGTPLALRVFEPRYLEMIEGCLAGDGRFGVALIRDGREAFGPLPEPHAIGCAAEIRSVQRLPNGHLHLETLGRERFRVESMARSEPYLVGRVEPMPLRASGAEDDLGARRDAIEPLLQRYLVMLARISGSSFSSAELPRDPGAMAWLAAYVLQLPADEKQDLLGSQDLGALLAEEHRLLCRETPLLKTMLGQPKAPDGRPFSVN